jgi:phage gp46-like protein
MTDIRIVNVSNLEGTIADWFLQKDGTLDEREELANIVKVALMTDRLADATEILPDPDSIDRRGWWGDFEAEEIWDGWQIGTKNWLLTRAKISNEYAQEGSTVERARAYTLEAVQPMITRGYCTFIDVQAERVGIERIDVVVTLYRGPKPEIQLVFQGLWEETTGVPSLTSRGA